MQIHEIRRDHAYKKSKLVGRGGTRGKTSGHGGKGQTARAGHRVRPMIRDVIKKLPKLRGHGKNRSLSVFYRGPEAVVNVGVLNVFGKEEVVTPETLVSKGLIGAIFGKNPKVKILGTGELTAVLTVKGCTVSETAKTKIESLGGTITNGVKAKPQKEKKVKEIKTDTVKTAIKTSIGGKVKAKKK
jgi:large subunit ribosomal protein L15